MILDFFLHPIFDFLTKFFSIFRFIFCIEIVFFNLLILNMM
jgi:hypothetical protein